MGEVVVAVTRPATAEALMENAIERSNRKEQERLQEVYKKWRPGPSAMSSYFFIMCLV